VIVSADNKILVKAIADYIEDGLAKDNIFPVHKEGYSDGNWVLMDFGDVVAHIFLEQERDFYNLEQLWADAPSEQIGTNDGE
jgi:ribosome-associated protein